jgi:hypothetical protein
VSTAPASAAKLDLYLDRLAAHHTPTGRLIFALDATASREPTWDAATTLTASMFAAVTALDVQLVFYRGVNECRASSWTSDARVLTKWMSSVRCAAGATQIGRILAHAKKEDAKQKVSALVFVGDAVEENPDTLCVRFDKGSAKELGELLGAVAAYASGGQQALKDMSTNASAVLLLKQLR